MDEIAQQFNVPFEADDIRVSAVERMAMRMEENRDKLISRAITAAIGDGWALESLFGRLAVKILPSKVEVLSLDGKDLLELHPTKFEHVADGGSIQIRAVQDYRFLIPVPEEMQALPSGA